MSFNLPEYSDLFPNEWVLVHSMGKVGSYSVYKSLQRCKKFRVLHTHELNRKFIHKKYGRTSMPGHATSSLRFLDNYQADDKVKLIVSVREPMSRNVSAFFENLANFGITPNSTENIDDVVQTFVEKYHHRIPLHWFDMQLRKPFGIDLMRSSKSAKRQFAQGKFEVLVLRTEDSDQDTNQSIQDFLACENFELQRMNVGEDKPYADLYKAFKEAFVPSTEMLSLLFDANYFQKFYTATEQAQIRAKWAG